MSQTVEERPDGPVERESTDEWLAKMKRVIAEGRRRSIEEREAAERRHREYVWLFLLANGYFAPPPPGMLDPAGPMD